MLLVSGYITTVHKTTTGTLILKKPSLETFQSGFLKLHSTETAVLYVLNELLVSSDSGSMNVLLLDLCTVFDAINYDMLISPISLLLWSQT